uniref:Uncharacterized protein n=1 Tax=Octopus bimaculoides TaxID=37653 RepID=A0A0L8GCF7_OCTBM
MKNLFKNLYYLESKFHFKVVVIASDKHTKEGKKRRIRYNITTNYQIILLRQRTRIILPTNLNLLQRMVVSYLTNSLKLFRSNA